MIVIIGLLPITALTSFITEFSKKEHSSTKVCFFSNSQKSGFKEWRIFLGESSKLCIVVTIVGLLKISCIWTNLCSTYIQSFKAHWAQNGARTLTFQDLYSPHFIWATHLKLWLMLLTCLQQQILSSNFPSQRSLRAYFVHLPWVIHPHESICKSLDSRRTNRTCHGYEDVSESTSVLQFYAQIRHRSLEVQFRSLLLKFGNNCF